MADFNYEPADDPSPAYPYVAAATTRRNGRRRAAEPDPRTLAREFFDSNQGMIHNTSGLDAEAREPYYDIVSSRGWQETARTVIIPLIRKLRRDLLHNEKLTEAQRQRQQGFLFYMYAVIVELYRRAGEDIPAGLRKEFN
jgi:hypothetical protein